MEVEWKKRKAVAQKQWDDWMKLKPKLQQEVQAEDDKKMKELEALRHKEGYEKLNECLKLKEEADRRRANGEKETVEDIQQRWREREAAKEGISVDEFVALQKQAKLSGETPFSIERRKASADEMGMGLETYDEHMKTKSRHRRRLEQEAQHLKVHWEQMVRQRVEEAAAQGISVEQLELRLDEAERAKNGGKVDEEVEFEMRNEPYDYTTAANTAANTGCITTAAGSSTALMPRQYDTGRKTSPQRNIRSGSKDQNPVSLSDAQQLAHKLGKVGDKMSHSVGLSSNHRQTSRPTRVIPGKSISGTLKTDPETGKTEFVAAIEQPRCHPQASVNLDNFADFGEEVPVVRHPAAIAFANDDNFWAMVNRRAAEHRREHGCANAFCRTTRTDVPFRFAPFKRNPGGLHPTADVRFTEKLEKTENQGKAWIRRENARATFGLIKVKNGKGKRWTDMEARKLGLDRQRIKEKIAEEGGRLSDWGLREDNEEEACPLGDYDWGKKRNQ